MMENKRVVPSIVKIDALAAQFGYFSERQHITRRAFSNTRWRLSRRGEKQMEKLDRITTDPARMNGEPSIRNLRLTVRRVLEALAIYPDRAELKREYPELEDEDIRQVLAFAAALVDDKVLPIPHAR
jgi:uncharacterized protein (DUF433 family)